MLTNSLEWLNAPRMAIEGGGGYRFLANLHARLPRVPFFTSWVDRSQAIPNARRALALAPEHPGNRLLYASLRLDLGGGSTAEALAELRGVASIEPRPEELAEDLAVRRSARERLAKAETAGVRAGPQPRPWAAPLPLGGLLPRDPINASPALAWTDGSGGPDPPRRPA